ncbi:MAG: PEP-CTERM sorting domain-containing protein [Candidatus Acidiferrales bacterium]
METGVFNLIDEQTGNSYTLAVTEVPEPATLLLLGSGPAAIVLLRKRALAH